MGTYRVLRGLYQDKTAKVVRLRDEPSDKDGVKGKRLCQENVFCPGDVIRTDRDLLKKNSPGSIKFERLEETVVTEDVSREYTNLEEELKEMTVAKLRKHAEAEGIDLGTATSKEEIINTIRAALQEA